MGVPLIFGRDLSLSSLQKYRKTWTWCGTIMRLITAKRQWMVLVERSKAWCFRRVLSRQMVINSPREFTTFANSICNVECLYLPIDEIMDESVFMQDISAVPETLKTHKVVRGFSKHDVPYNKYVSNCRGFQVSINDNSREPLIITELPKSPWESVFADFYGPLPSG